MKHSIACLLPACVVLASSPAPAQIRINEIRINEPGLDLNEYVELAGPPGASLDGYTYVVLGDETSTVLGSGVIEEAQPLTGSVIPPSGFFVVAEATFTLGVANRTEFLEFESDDNVTHFLVTGFTGADGQDLDTNDDGVLDVTPWTSVVDRVALIRENNPPTTSEYHYGPAIVGPQGSAVPRHVFRSPDGAAVLSSWNIGEFAAGVTDTPGAPNQTPSISLASGGTQRLALDAGPAYAGDLYVIVTNFTGTSPGIFVPPIVVPLNWDTLLELSLQMANGPIWTNTFGSLGSSGRAFASLNVPPLPGDAAGLTLNSAAVLLTPSLVPVVASNPVPLQLVR
jgi:hypothetical protein